MTRRIAHDFMNKHTTKIVLITFLLISIVSLFELGVILKLTGHFPNIKNIIRLKAVSTTKSPNNTENSSEAEKNKEPTKYRVIASSSPILGWQSKINLKVTNISVTPFIGVVAVNECNFVDTQGEKYKGKFLNAQYTFPKALLPEENGEAPIPFLSLDLDGGGGIGYGGYKQKCSYDDQGYNVCSNIKPLRITECTVYVIPTGQASNGWGLFPLKVAFP